MTANAVQASMHLGGQVESCWSLGRTAAAVPTTAFPSGASAILLLLQMSEAPSKEPQGPSQNANGEAFQGLPEALG